MRVHSKMRIFAIYTTVKRAIFHMESLPRDPYMLLSMINMKLRDQYATLDELCDDLDVDRGELERQLGTAGFEYDANTNSFR